MYISDDAMQVRVQGWRTLAALHAQIVAALEKALQREHDLSVIEYTVLDALSCQDGWHMRMRQLAGAVVLSHSATTRLVTRLEARDLLSRYLCEDDRRGIYTEVTPQGRQLLARSRPTHDRALTAALAAAEEVPELKPLVEALDELHRAPDGQRSPHQDHHVTTSSRMP